jgi:hypothetical protein
MFVLKSEEGGGKSLYLWHNDFAWESITLHNFCQVKIMRHNIRLADYYTT